EARQKLDATEQDLARIEDLLFEINNQLKTLESQAKKAEKYFEIKKDYREVSIELAKASLEGFNTSYKNLQSQSESETDKKFQLEAMIAGEEAALEREKLEFIEKEKQLQLLQHSFNDLVQQLRNKEGEKNLAGQRADFLQEKETNLLDFLSRGSGQITGLEESLHFTDNQVGEEDVKLEHLRQNLETLRDKTELAKTSFG